MLATGRGVFELTGYRETELIGRNVVDALGLERRSRTCRTRPRWRSSGASAGSARSSQLRSRAGTHKPVIADFFPAYDEDGGLLVALAPR